MKKCDDICTNFGVLMGDFFVISGKNLSKFGSIVFNATQIFGCHNMTFLHSEVLTSNDNLHAKTGSECAVLQLWPGKVWRIGEICRRGRICSCRRREEANLQLEGEYEDGGNLHRF